MSDTTPAPKCESGSPAWVMTFADLMSLLMCFFVLLLSFSEMDVLKFKQIAGSMAFAFGVQREVKVREIPKGTSVVMKEFSPGKPEPTPLNEVRQHTTDDLRRMLAVDEKDEPEEDATEKASGRSREDILRELTVLAEKDADNLRAAFQAQIDRGLIDIETDQERIIIRIQEKGSFPSGSADLKEQFEPIIHDIGAVLAKTTGNIIVAGHSDDVPIATKRFRSNWELSAARAVTVVHHLQRVIDIGVDRFLVEGHADTRPLVPNDSTEHRARNRRVEVIIVKGSEVGDEAQSLERVTVVKEPPPAPSKSPG